MQTTIKDIPSFTMRKHTKTRKCECCDERFPSCDMEGNFCPDCNLELEGQREHERIESFFVRRP